MFEILTINDPYNYGNRLQNYALTSMLSRYDDVSTIQELPNASGAFRYVYARYFWRGVCRTKLIVNGVKAGIATPSCVKCKSFARFNADFACFRSSILSEFRGYDGEPLITDRFIIGSDQVWNYKWLSEGELRLRLGMFAKPGKLLTYAASIGLDDIDAEWRPIFKEGWSRIPHLSVREDRAAELVQEISGKDASVVLDPTLMLTAERWSEVFTGFVPEDDRYVLTYFLGRPSDQQETVIQGYAKANGFRVRRINDERDGETYAAGPAEFAELFAKASYVFTDSYHACCFSILNNIPFKVFNRQGFSGAVSMNSRMRTLFRLFELEDLMGDDDELAEFDWPHINVLLEKHRAESRVWLESALGVA